MTSNLIDYLNQVGTGDLLGKLENALLPPLAFFPGLTDTQKAEAIGGLTATAVGVAGAGALGLGANVGTITANPIVKILTNPVTVATALGTGVLRGTAGSLAQDYLAGKVGGGGEVGNLMTTSPSKKRKHSRKKRKKYARSHRTRR